MKTAWAPRYDGIASPVLKQLIDDRAQLSKSREYISDDQLRTDEIGLAAKRRRDMTRKINNKWAKPKFVKETLVDCDGAQVRVKAGTQFIDGWWRILKKECRYLKASRAHNVDLVRAAQWNHWHQGEDKVVAATSALACSFRV